MKDELPRTSGERTGLVMRAGDEAGQVVEPRTLDFKTTAVTLGGLVLVIAVFQSWGFGDESGNAFAGGHGGTLLFLAGTLVVTSFLLRDRPLVRVRGFWALLAVVVGVVTAVDLNAVGGAADFGPVASFAGAALALGGALWPRRQRIDSDDGAGR